MIGINFVVVALQTHTASGLSCLCVSLNEDRVDTTFMATRIYHLLLEPKSDPVTMVRIRTNRILSLGKVPIISTIKGTILDHQKPRLSLQALVDRDQM